MYVYVVCMYVLKIIDLPIHISPYFAQLCPTVVLITILLITKIENKIEFHRNLH